MSTTERQSQNLAVPADTATPKQMGSPHRNATGSQLYLLNLMGMLQVVAPGTMKPAMSQESSWWLEHGKEMGYYKDGEGAKNGASQPDIRSSRPGA